MPLYFLLTRQTVTDTPFVACLICAMACAIIGQFDDAHHAPHRLVVRLLRLLRPRPPSRRGCSAWGCRRSSSSLYALASSSSPGTRRAWAAHWQWLTRAEFRKEVREGQAAHAGPLREMSRMRLCTGIRVFFAVAGPWYAVMCAFDAVDDEGKRFFYRFFIHDHLNRLSAGVHTTTPGGTFIYFIEQGGFAIFPWVALLPGALAVVSPLRLRSGWTCGGPRGLHRAALDGCSASC